MNINMMAWSDPETISEKEVIVRLESLEHRGRSMAQEELCRKLTSLGAHTPTRKWLKIEVGDSPLQSVQ